MSHTSNELSSDRQTAIKYARFFIERIGANAISVGSPTRINQPGVGICLADISILIPLELTVTPEPSNPDINRSNKGLTPVFFVGIIIRVGSLAEIKIRYFGDTKMSLSGKSSYAGLLIDPSNVGSDANVKPANTATSLPDEVRIGTAKRITG